MLLVATSLLQAADPKQFTIVIPSYNNIEYYERNLESILNQDYADYRVYYIDDASTDGFGTGRYEQTLPGILCYLQGLRIFSQDYKQKNPILLDLEDSATPFYITWMRKQVSDKTIFIVHAVTLVMRNIT